MSAFLASVCKDISTATDRLFELQSAHSCSGGCINRATLVKGKCGSSYFLKSNGPVGAKLFAAEADGLRAIAVTQTIRTPMAICQGVSADGTAYLVMEALELSHTGDSALMGRQLAELHKITGDYFGWERDNFIGITPQKNAHYTSWLDFFREQRLEYQLVLARNRGLCLRDAQKLLNRLDVYFQDYAPAPSLLHGDLWNGNTGFTTTGEPLVFDPAVYYGDRETDLAFTYMFGGFEPEFYRGYQAVWPLDSGFEIRKPLYNLYHQLNHFNLFGGSYGTQANLTIKQLLAT